MSGERRGLCRMLCWSYSKGGTPGQLQGGHLAEAQRAVRVRMVEDQRDQAAREGTNVQRIHHDLMARKK
jgi:hypothetical protein